MTVPATDERSSPRLSKVPLTRAPAQRRRPQAASAGPTVWCAANARAGTRQG
jgi:hypothetical protein